MHPQSLPWSGTRLMCSLCSRTRRCRVLRPSGMPVKPWKISAARAQGMAAASSRTHSTVCGVQLCCPKARRWSRGKNPLLALGTVEVRSSEGRLALQVFLSSRQISFVHQRLPTALTGQTLDDHTSPKLACQLADPFTHKLSTTRRHVRHNFVQACIWVLFTPFIQFVVDLFDQLHDPLMPDLVRPPSLHRTHLVLSFDQSRSAFGVFYIIFTFPENWDCPARFAYLTLTTRSGNIS